MRTALPWLLAFMAGCTTANNPASLATGLPLATSMSVPNDNSGLREKLHQAKTAAVSCVLHQAFRLARQPENPEHIALAAMIACGRQEQALRDVAELVYGRDRSLAHMHLIEEATRQEVVALVAPLRSGARQKQPPKPGARRGTDI